MKTKLLRLSLLAATNAAFVWLGGFSVESALFGYAAGVSYLFLTEGLTK